MLRLISTNRPAAHFNRELYASDRDKLLAAAERATGRQYLRPCEALDDLFRLLRWRVDTEPIQGNQWALLEPWTRTITVCSRIRSKMSFPASEAGARNFTLAHELGHVRLHIPEIKAGRLVERHEEEADHYAGVFLVPFRQLQKRPEFERLKAARVLTSEQLWLVTRDLGYWFGVTSTAMAHQLDKLRILRLDPTTGKLEAA
jgi:hypothetical protein